jgi:antitoxin component YwqK of YwqJK toxin-antitoxin module
MKQTHLIITALMLVVGCSSDKETPSSQAREPIDGSTLVGKNGVWHAPDSDKPYSGVAVRYYGNGQKRAEGTYKDGELDGFSTLWYENGQKSEEGTWKDEKRDGLWTDWYENGQKGAEVTWKDGKQIGKIKRF